MAISIVCCHFREVKVSPKVMHPFCFGLHASYDAELIFLRSIFVIPIRSFARQQFKSYMSYCLIRSFLERTRLVCLRVNLRIGNFLPLSAQLFCVISSISGIFSFLNHGLIAF